MRARFIVLVFTAVVALGFALAPGTLAQGVQGPAGNSNMARLALNSNCPMHPDAWGKVTYNLAGSTLRVVLNAHNLPTEGEYRLYYGDTQYITAQVNEDGDLHITATVSGADILPSARFQLVHIHEHDHDHDGAGCVILVSEPHGYTFTG